MSDCASCIYIGAFVGMIGAWIGLWLHNKIWPPEKKP
jgi:hypothetical protein